MNNIFLEKSILPIGDLILGTSFIKHLLRLRKEVNLTHDEINILQKNRLFDILKLATLNSKYYKNLLKYENNDCIKWLKNFPIIDKEILQNERDNLITTKSKNLIKLSSSGSSGLRSVVYSNKDEISIHRATQILWWEWAGYHLGQPILQTGITPNRGIIKGLKDILLSTYYLQAFTHDPSDLDRALKWAQKKSNPFLGGYASSLYVLANYAKEHNIQLQFASAVSWGDKLFDHYKAAIETVFKTKVFETYGSAEGLMIAAQKDLPYMYIMTPNVYLEILDDNGNEVKDGEMGHVVVTSLVAKAMPLIRYKIGDLAIKLPKDKYPQKRELSLPLLQKVIGRDTDLVKTASGKYMVVHSFTGIFEHISEIKQFCVIQENLNGIKIQYIPNKNFNSDILHLIEKKIQQNLQESTFKIQFEEVSFIPPTPSGKPQIIISKLNK
ncbi:hypothetical protein [Thermaurantimonas aggregans]|uniref:hypothetical protein n=1 Tax=Thermaurantimonas aggregans TaxID=2173829 RepID=UPI0023F0C6B7|nr:hypothetical protein [Thermaurantimonas aggregans]MCX8148594.1 hypothetical protein [Thermaurantimonas aggregans]